MSDSMPPKKKRPRVAGQPPAGAGAKRGSGSAKRAPIERLAGADAKAAKTSPLKGASAKRVGKGKLAAPVSTAKAAGSSASAGGGVAKTAPRAAGGQIPRGAQLLGLIGLIGLIVGLLGFWHPGGVGRGSDQSFINSKATAEVLGQMDTAACLSPKPGETFEQWMKLNRSWLAGKALDQWNKSEQANRQIFEQTAGAKQDCKVRAIGVRDLTGSGNGSTAHVLVNFATSTAGSTANSMIITLQMEVERMDGRWRIRQIDTW
ncbi:MAG: hypothetical protein QM728_12070 [Gordonia sp. (in: high G+C Gram-positive bacteria)]|uniref:hypothetical protein n=1 Tax=Gordonia sp. (in: high G+C Gram-positive bacteria) TaxID=84139 RepID=UPI0039E576B6